MSCIQVKVTRRRPESPHQEEKDQKTLVSDQLHRSACRVLILKSPVKVCATLWRDRQFFQKVEIVHNLGTLDQPKRYLEYQTYRSKVSSVEHLL